MGTLAVVWSYESVVCCHSFLGDARMCISYAYEQAGVVAATEGKPENTKARPCFISDMEIPDIPLSLLFVRGLHVERNSVLL